MALGKAPEIAPDAMEKPMPEYPLDRNELVYPGEGDPFTSKAPPSEASRRPVTHSAAPQTGVPRDKIHLGPIGMKTWMEDLERCIAACERSAVQGVQNGSDPKPGLCVTMSRDCADI